MSSEDINRPILHEPIKNQEIEIKPINLSVNYPPAGQGYLGDPNHPQPHQQPPTFYAGPMQGPPGNRPQGGPQGGPPGGPPMMMGPGGGGINRPMGGGGGPMMGGPMMGGPQSGPFMGGPPMGSYPMGGPMMGGPPNQSQFMGGPGGAGGPGGLFQGRAGAPGGFIQGGPPVDKTAIRNMVTMDDEYTKQKEYEKSYPCYEDCMQSCCNCCGTCRQFLPCLCVPDPNIEVPQSWCALKMRFGRYVDTLNAGLQFVTPTTEKLILVDLQTQTLDLVKQNIITKDNITAAIDTAINFKIINPRYAMFRLENLQESVKNLTYSALRTVCGVYTLNELQEKKAELAHQLQQYVGERVKQWGIIIEQIFIKDMVLSNDLQQTLSSAAKMQRAAESKVISAKADVESAKLMREAADSLSSEAAMQIRYYETISHLANNGSQKVVFIPFIQDQGF